MLKIVSYSKSYNQKVKAVDNLSLHINKGDIFGFIGHNGAGKTTTIKSIAGILDFEDGDIFIDGKSIKKDAIECKKIMAYIPDNPDLYLFMTGIKYLNFIADIYDVSVKDREERIKKYSDAFELTKDLGDPIASYSHGMRQKLALISALIHEPKLLLLDEPFVGLDPKASFTLKEIMKDMCQKGSAIFFSTHVLDVAEKLCNKVAIIKGGKLVTTGDMNEVKGNSSLEQFFLELVDHE